MNSQIEQIIEEQGWNESSVLSILWAYVEAQAQDDAVLDHFLNAQSQEIEPEPEEDIPPCLRELDHFHTKWLCVNDHTGCLWNDGHNVCSHEGDSLHPLEDVEIGL